MSRSSAAVFRGAAAGSVPRRRSSPKALVLAAVKQGAAGDCPTFGRPDGRGGLASCRIAANWKMGKTMPLMAGKQGLIMGVANERSIAWGIAKALRAHGADLAFTYQGEALGKRVRPLALEPRQRFRSGGRCRFRGEP